MEFKANDRCEVFGTGTYGDGMKLTVISKAPRMNFELPNGQMHTKAKDDHSYVVLLDEKVSASTSIGGGVVTNQFRTNYGVVDGNNLRLIEGERND